MAAPNSTFCVSTCCAQPELNDGAHQKRPRAFVLHNIAALRCATELGLTSAARTLFDAQCKASRSLRRLQV